MMIICHIKGRNFIDESRAKLLDCGAENFFSTMKVTPIGKKTSKIWAMIPVNTYMTDMEGFRDVEVEMAWGRECHARFCKNILNNTALVLEDGFLVWWSENTLLVKSTPGLCLDSNWGFSLSCTVKHNFLWRSWSSVAGKNGSYLCQQGGRCSFESQVVFCASKQTAHPL